MLNIGNKQEILVHVTSGGNYDLPGQILIGHRMHVVSQLKIYLFRD